MKRDHSGYVPSYDPRSERVLRALGVNLRRDAIDRTVVPLWAAALCARGSKLSVAKDEGLVHWLKVADDERHAVSAVALRDLARAGDFARELYATRDDAALALRLSQERFADGRKAQITPRDPYADGPYR